MSFAKGASLETQENGEVANLTEASDFLIAGAGLEPATPAL